MRAAHITWLTGADTKGNVRATRDCAPSYLLPVTASLRFILDRPPLGCQNGAGRGIKAARHKNLPVLTSSRR
jgi:hypothetical protein